ncbi:TRAP transporter substrate-binding protein [Falsigemmobacter intermedius]|uniref:TRAP transporter substrate-binding protein n=1 Tax=Falsigemmobacter intermedius TaxID=1553448 RepID=A0A444MB81_9RHOB|nr:TRAP transporter substrate-binding protein [Falsigemmobacter intermedius]RWY40990.1 TRAP transporter substrate-binding protein [Falsigemmobacter intermedius]
MSFIRYAAAALLATATMAQAETLRFASFEPPQAYVTKNVLTAWAEDVSKASEGTLDVKMFAGGTLGRAPDQQLKLVEDGVADLAWVIPGYSPGRFVEGSVAELPFLVPDSTAGSKAMWKMYEDGIFANDYNKFKLIGVVVSAPNFIASTKKITEPEDLNGVNFRGPGPVLLTALKAVGAVPIGGITGANLADSISRGLVEGTLTEWTAGETFRVTEVANNYLMAPLGATPMLVLMNKARYDALPEKAKAAIDQYSGAAFSERFGRIFDENMVAARKRAEDRKATITEVDAEAAARWEAAVRPATDAWIAETPNGQQIYDAMKAALAAAK